MLSTSPCGLGAVSHVYVNSYVARISPSRRNYFSHATRVAPTSFIWCEQKTAEARKQVFDEAVKAIAMLEADTLNSGGKAFQIRQETTDQMQKALALVEAFFSGAAFDVLSQYLKRDLSKGPDANLNQLSLVLQTAWRRAIKTKAGHGVITPLPDTGNRRHS
jgi:hypothetical protein